MDDSPAFTVDGCDLDDFAAIVELGTDASAYPLARTVIEGVVIYGRDAVADRCALRAEVTRALVDGPGIVVLEGAVGVDAVDQVSAAFWRMIEDQHARGELIGDHYAKPGANDRVWNTIEKLAVDAPEAFASYYASDAIALAAEAWLGPAYQVSSQVNVVNPGGEAQQPHRDYHLGFMTDAVASRYPRHAHLLSPALTLQGAVAHCDMPVESGPTTFLPHSHKYDRGYLAWRRPEFIDYFETNHVQLPLAKGDAVFFSPALFHAAGHNRSADIKRMANLLQISSPFGRAMETIDRTRMVKALYPALLDMKARGADERALSNAVAAAAEGYAFPTNLDHDQPVDGLAPPSQADLVRQALFGEWSAE